MDNSALTEVPTPDSTDALMFDLGDYTLGWRPSGLALERASDKGMELGEILADLQTLFASDIDLSDFDEEELEEMSEEEIEEELEGDLSSGFSDLTSVYAKLVWLGALHFEAGIKLDAILAIIDPESLEDLPIDQMLQRVFPAIQDEMGEDEMEEAEEEDTKGK
ncbi:hypothetical protein GGP85_002914 [Salinibacter ruber]|jgi:hypothetical protein|uniref:hypothetical protein n=1 Tax=Salinibacter ruber TaxID=146919 RepID=UPI002168F18B|nr:hypothetical protein [Salinibacter ruber]MCS3827444.1 hypothetical protein [Salinibacter ruber]